uniref:Endonuclease/exonuclease/phosphatase domain-containing protein n=1 Tax=Chromera velia CCMP2878 TaxID=1169474 RepID=A0A0G4HTY8_9ALVE|eukprot:Cvel_8550.t1-p1 / transcript=Cvel_8550.t1 / gene=Cvel_8550 / organism=Chromera_velia_CCMP2878 / gene_product=hypothetical protein / transcript_product=hypothetical protein / location=Cvel_scaffold474:22496-23791(+) / protein_length=432 / sequence_SO=supercontig / SO=protein_coding / is_pseudo=false
MKHKKDADGDGIAFRHFVFLLIAILSLLLVLWRSDKVQAVPFSVICSKTSAHTSTMTSPQSVLNAFRVATCNVLFEPYYARHCKTASMDTAARVAAWRTFGSSDLFKSSHLILLQEFASGDADWASVFSGSSLRLELAREKGDSTAIAFDETVFELQSQHTAVEKLDRAKTALRLVLQHRTTGIQLAVVSAHVPWSNVQSTQVEWMERLRQFALRDLPDEILIFVGGDFNIRAAALKSRQEAESPQCRLAGSSQSGKMGELLTKSRKSDAVYQSEWQSATQSLSVLDTLPGGFRFSDGWVDVTAPLEWSHMAREGPVRLDYLLIRSGALWRVLNQKLQKHHSQSEDVSEGISANLSSEPPSVASWSDQIFEGFVTQVFPSTANELVKHDRHDPVKYGEAFLEHSFSDHAFLSVDIPLSFIGMEKQAHADTVK